MSIARPRAFPRAREGAPPKCAPSVAKQHQALRTTGVRVARPVSARPRQCWASMSCTLTALVTALAHQHGGQLGRQLFRRLPGLDGVHPIGAPGVEARAASLQVVVAARQQHQPALRPAQPGGQGMQQVRRRSTAASRPSQRSAQTMRRAPCRKRGVETPAQRGHKAGAAVDARRRVATRCCGGAWGLWRLSSRHLMRPAGAQPFVQQFQRHRRSRRGARAR